MVVTEPTLKRRIIESINMFSRENVSNTPDFILAGFLMSCLSAFEQCSNARENWYGKHLTIQSVSSLSSPSENATQKVVATEARAQPCDEVEIR